jgi:hypothetical protein
MGMNIAALLNAEENLVTLDGWQSWTCSQPSARPEVIELADWRRMTPRQRDAYDARRMEHHSSFGPVPTPTTKPLYNALRNQFWANAYGRPGIPRPAAVLDGPSGLGKSTLLWGFGQMLERELRCAVEEQRLQSQLPDRWAPVAVVPLTSDTTVRGFALKALGFYGAVTPPRVTKDEAAVLLTEMARDCRTRLFLIDDVHFLEMGNETHRHVNNFLKTMMSQVQAQFVFAGINCTSTGFLTEGHGPNAAASSQTRERTAVHAFAAFKQTQAVKWRSLLTYFEREVVLLRASDDDLSGELAAYMWARTEGKIGRVSKLVREGALLAIQSDQERFTEALLNEVSLPD